VDLDGSATVLDPADYQVDTVMCPARILPSPGERWPETQQGRTDAVTVTYIAGYADAANVPAGVKVAIKLMVAHLFENRLPVAVGTIVSEMPFTVEALLQPHRVYELG
jgi:uncharacterized phiE125 gp8 family phage protein